MVARQSDDATAMHDDSAREAGVNEAGTELRVGTEAGQQRRAGNGALGPGPAADAIKPEAGVTAAGALVHEDGIPAPAWLTPRPVANGAPTLACSRLTTAAGPEPASPWRNGRKPEEKGAALHDVGSKEDGK